MATGVKKEEQQQHLVGMEKERKLASTGIVDSLFFYEDEVFKIDKKGRIKFGLVLGSFDDSLTSSDSESEVLTKGQIRVAWHPDGKEEVLAENQVILGKSSYVTLFYLKEKDSPNQFSYAKTSFSTASTSNANKLIFGKILWNCKRRIGFSERDRN